MANKGDQNIFVKCTSDWLERVTDKLFDNGFKVGQCSDWFYRAQMFDHHSEKLENSIVYELDEEDLEFQL